MKVALTGASGFVGRFVLQRLLQEDLDISVISKASFNESSACVRYIEMDISSATSDIFDRLGQPDVLIHLAWSGLPNYFSLHHFESELPKQYDFLKKMVEGGLSSMLVVGTCYEYGMHFGPCREDTPPKPNNPYGFAKNALREQLQFLKLDRNFELTWCRLFYLYGEGQTHNSLFPSIQQAVANGNRSFSLSHGEQLRDYLQIEVAADRLVRLALMKRDLGIVNVCSGEPVSIRRQVEQWSREFQWDISFDYGVREYQDYEPIAFWGDDTKFRNLIREQDSTWSN